jgi:hypothetical protein
MKALEANARNQAIIAYVTGATFLGAIIVAIAISQAKEVIRPVHDMALGNKKDIEHLNQSIEEIKSTGKETLTLIREMRNR